MKRIVNEALFFEKFDNIVNIKNEQKEEGKKIIAELAEKSGLTKYEDLIEKYSEKIDKKYEDIFNIYNDLIILVEDEIVEEEKQCEDLVGDKVEEPIIGTNVNSEIERPVM